MKDSRVPCAAVSLSAGPMAAKTRRYSIQVVDIKTGRDVLLTAADWTDDENASPSPRSRGWPVCQQASLRVSRSFLRPTRHLGRSGAGANGAPGGVPCNYLGQAALATNAEDPAAKVH